MDEKDNMTSDAATPSTGGTGTGPAGGTNRKRIVFGAAAVSVGAAAVSSVGCCVACVG